jgi:hypothetical protein
MSERKLSAYPLLVNNPYFSIWSNTNKLNEADTIFWNGLIRKTYGVVNVNGVSYSFLGKLDRCIELEQTKVSLGLFSTDYEFDCDLFTLNVSFISPTLLTDLDLMSRPVCYVSYIVYPKQEIKSLKVALLFHQSHCYNKMDDYVIGGCFPFKNYEAAYFGLNRQHPMSHTGDSFAADWGYTYLIGNESFFTSLKAVDKFIDTGIMEYIHDSKEEKYIVAINSYQNINTCQHDKFLIAFDDICSIYYFGEWCKSYYFRNGKTIFNAIEEAYEDYDETLSKLHDFENKFNEDIKEYDEDYKTLCYASFRQSISAHSLVENSKGELLFLSKECHSNGCIATVDITYPSMPLYLLYNPELVSAMTRPIFKFSRMPIWKFSFAPHDAGTFPYCLGQTYGLYADETKNDKYLSNMFQRNRWNGIMVSHPLIYQFPDTMDIYNLECQMPIEECSNMLIASYSSIYFGADDNVVKENYDLLKKWCYYLIEKGLVPTNQLCTDDFFEKIDKNVNLSIKALQAIKCFSLIAKHFNYNEDFNYSIKELEKLLNQFNEMFKDYDHLPISYYGDKDTYGLKYNLAFDSILKTNLFTQELKDKELNYYLSKNTKYSIPLDNRSDLTKTDWLLFVASLTDNKDIQQKIYKGIVNFLKESECRVPFSDLYHTETGIIKDFQNRPVQGGIFILLLKDKANKK